MIDFSKTFDLVWHPALFHKPILAGLPSCSARWTQFFSQWTSSKLTSSPTSFFIFCLRFNPTPTFLGVTFDYTLSFSKHVSSLKAKFFPHLKALRCISASTWCSFKESLSVLYKGFLQPLHLCFTRIVSFVNVTNRLSPKWNAFTERLVAPSPAIDLLYPTSLRRLYLSYESH